MRIEEKEGSFIIVDFNDIEAYKIARKIENDGIVFYQNLKEKAKDKKMCETMDLLLQEEKRHLAFFENALFEQRENNDESLEEDDLLDEMDYGIFPSPDAGDTAEKLLESPEKAIGVGIVMENRSLQFYQACRRFNINHLSFV